MAATYLFAVEGLDTLPDLETIDKNLLLKARQAINRAADRARTQADRQIRTKLNFPARYLSSRLTVRDRATGTNLSAVIMGRDQPTSLARFVTNKNANSIRKAGGATVHVGTGGAKKIPGSFLITLRNGNQGLALRLKPGETVKGKRVAAKQLAPNLYLLYGVSVDQAFRTEVDKSDLLDDTLDFLETEFRRLMEL